MMMVVIRPEELFHFDDRGKGTRNHSLKLVKVRCTRDSRRHFFSSGVIKSSLISSYIQGIVSESKVLLPVGLFTICLIIIRH